MTRDEVIERIAVEIHGVPDLWDMLSPKARGRFRDDAGRILDLLAPKLVWEDVNGWQFTSGEYLICDTRKHKGLVYLYLSPDDDEPSAFPTLEAAQAAAEAHAFQEWIKTTPMGAGE